MALQLADILQHTFHCHKDWQKDGTSIKVSSGEEGFITGASPDLSQVNITLFRPTRVTIQAVPIANLRIGRRYIAGDSKAELPVVLQGPIFTSIRNHPPGEASYRNDADPFRKGVAAFLSGVWTNRGRIPYLSRLQQTLIQNDDVIKATTQRFRNHIACVNPQFFATMANGRSTLNDFISILRTANGNDVDAGIYLLIVDRFKPGSSRANFQPEAYVGQSGNIGTRIKSHISTANGNQKGQEVHQAMRESQRWRWFKLAKHDRDEGGSAEVGKAMRDVMETTFMMIFGTMSARVMAPTLRNTSMLEADAVLNYDDQEMAKLFTDIASDAFGKIGFTLPSVRSRRPPFGLHQYGLNYTIPLGGESADVYDRVLWCRQDVGKTFVFHRSPLKLRKDLHVFQMSYSNHDKRNLPLIIQPTAPEIKDMGISPGDEYHPVWEVQKPGHGRHHTPFFRLCEMGPWDNWFYANRAGFKLMWKDKKGAWKTKYLQRDARLRFVENCVAPGALLDYSLGVGVYCYFMRTRFPNAQDWSADFGIAKLVTAALDNFNQRIIVAHVAGACEKLVGPKLELEVCRRWMVRTGLQNVNGPWMSFDFGWVSDPSCWKDGKVGAATSTRPYKQRKKCDYCYLGERSQLAGVHSISMKCERVGNSNMCAPCAKMGRPCSWTGLPYLFGVQDWHDEVYVKKATKGTVHQEAVKGLLCFPRNEEALQVHTIGQDPGLVAMGDGENTQHVAIQFHQLTPAEQGRFNSWEAQVNTLIGSIMKLKVGTAEYNARMQELQNLADSVTTANVSPRLYAYMSRRVQQDIMYFMINGRPYIRGG